jgi:TfuA protein
MLNGAVVFTGPSLHPNEARTLLDATILPPIRRGDLESIAALKPEAIGIIDGEFYQSLAVSPKEILPLLEAGVKVYGSSSIGALRAVELSKFGMLGVGRVFRLFRAGFLDADDEVAVAYDPSTYQATSEPLVNTRYMLRAAVRKCILTRAEAAEIVSKMKAVYFPERTRSLLFSVARRLMGGERSKELRQFVEREAPDIKRQDARMMIGAMSRVKV